MKSLSKKRNEYLDNTYDKDLKKKKKSSKKKTRGSSKREGRKTLTNP